MNVEEERRLGLTREEAVGRAHKLVDRQKQAVVVIRPASGGAGGAGAEPLPKWGYTYSTVTSWDEAQHHGKQLTGELLITRYHEEITMKGDEMVMSAPPEPEVGQFSGGTMRICIDCHEAKPVEQFSGRYHASPRCYSCQAALMRKAKEGTIKVVTETISGWHQARAKQGDNNAPLRAQLDRLAHLLGWERLDPNRKSGFWSVVGRRIGITGTTIRRTYLGLSIWATTYFALDKGLSEWIAELEQVGTPTEFFYDSTVVEKDEWSPVLDGTGDEIPYVSETMRALREWEQRPVNPVRSPLMSEWRQREAIRLLHRLNELPKSPAQGEYVALILDLLEGDTSD